MEAIYLEIQRLIIHSLDENLQTEILSERQMNLNDQKYTEDYIKRFVKSCLNSSGSYKGEFNETSKFKESIDESLNFVELTKELSKKTFALHKRLGDSKNLNLIYALVENVDELLLCFFEVHGKDGFIRIVNKDDVIENKIIHNSMILPNTFASVKASFILNLENYDLCLNGGVDYKEFFVELFDCELVANSKTAFGTMEEVIGEIMEQREEDALNKIIQTKETLHEVAQEYDIVSTEDVINEILEHPNDEEKEFIQEKFIHENIQDDLDLKKLKKSRVLSRHRIKTENGFEIVIPLNEMDLEPVFEVEENPDGTRNIIIKNVGNF